MGRDCKIADSVDRGLLSWVTPLISSVSLSNPVSFAERSTFFISSCPCASYLTGNDDE